MRVSLLASFEHVAPSRSYQAAHPPTHPPRSKEKLVRRAVITLIPRLAAFAPERFVKSYLKQVCGGDRQGGVVLCTAVGHGFALLCGADLAE